MGRRPEVPLDRQRIARVALELLDEGGAEALTVRRVAARLGVQSPSLYNHVRSKDELLDAVTEIVGRDVDVACLDDPDWRRGLTRFARSYRAAFRAHPRALALIALRTVNTDAALTVYDAALAALLRAGWSPRKALELLGAVDYLVLGSALLPFTAGFDRPAEAYAASYPSLSRALTTSPSPDALDESAFERGLADLLRRSPTDA
jgi:AcrR family transcriptional regulator